MEIQTQDPDLVDELDDTKLDGVSVTQRMTRSADPNVITIITLQFAANVNIPAVVAWILEKLRGKLGTKITYNRTNIELSAGPVRLAIEHEAYSKRK